MKDINFKYFFPTDILYIELSDRKSPVGDQDFQDNVILYKALKSKKVLSVEILHFKDFKKNHIQISQNKAIDFSGPFRFLRAFLSLQGIIITEPEEFKRIMSIWGYKIKKLENEIDLPWDKKKVPTKILDKMSELVV